MWSWIAVSKIVGMHQPLIASDNDESFWQLSQTQQKAMIHGNTTKLNTREKLSNIPSFKIWADELINASRLIFVWTVDLALLRWDDDLSFCGFLMILSSSDDCNHLTPANVQLHKDVCVCVVVFVSTQCGSYWSSCLEILGWAKMLQCFAQAVWYNCVAE